MEKYNENFGNSFSSEFSDSMNDLLKFGLAESTDRKFYLNEKGYSIADEILAKYFWTYAEGLLPKFILSPYNLLAMKIVMSTTGIPAARSIK